MIRASVAGAAAGRVDGMDMIAMATLKYRACKKK
jgi:TPP-dependent pyruvate/acetoin dehydrogenase alpha subunit